MGHRAERTLVQSDSLDRDTRTEIWNTIVILKQVFQNVRDETYGSDTTESNVLEAVWTWEFKQARDEMRSHGQVWEHIKIYVLNEKWFDVLDLVEALVGYLGRYKTHSTRDLVATFTEGFNNRFEHFLVGFRFIGQEITPIDSTAEAEAVVAATEDAASIAGARHALERAISLLADREKPDYPNSIKESISAVEAVVKKVTGANDDLAAGLKKLENAGLSIHPALKGAWLKMYGWTSDEDGIRHGGIDAADADQALAKYVLVTCSAFVSYLIEEGRKAGLLT